LTQAMTDTQSAAGPPFPPLSPRIRRWREASRERSDCSPQPTRQHDLLAAFFGPYADLPFPERYARAMAQALEAAPVYLLEDERLVGMTYQVCRPDVPPQPTPWDEQWRAYDPHLQTAQRQAEQIEPYLRVGGAPGHIGWRWDRILERGIAGHLADLEARLTSAPDARAHALYQGAIILWQTVLRWNDRHIAALRELAAAATGEERSRLEGLIALCQRVPRYPARTFHEALQSFYVQHLAVMFENPYGGNGPGRMDAILGPYLERDLADGRISLDEARDLVAELIIRLHERIAHADGWVEAVTVGGLGPGSAPAENTLTHLIIECVAAMDITHPSVYVRLSTQSSDELLDLTVRYLLHGRNRAQVYNDDVVLPALRRGGVPAADAAVYMAGGCMEISSQGAACDLNFAGTLNIAKTLELVLTGGIDLVSGQRRLALDRDLAAYESFDTLYRAFEDELARQYAEMVRAIDIASATYAELRPCYLLSSLVDDCLDRGREQQDGGARYHDYGFAPLGITTAADALHALDVAVYRERFVTAAELLSALRADFAGFEALRARLRAIPPYGHEAPEADGLCQRVLASVCDLATAQRTRFGGRLKPMVFNFVWTPGASKALGARPDGSRAGEAIGHGLTPAKRAMTSGITPAMNSCLTLDCTCVLGGATTMWDMDPQWIDEPLLRALLTSFLQRGGMIFQGNMTSVADLEDAYAHPERHPNLIVRVGGFSARFVTLDRDVQLDVLARHRHRG